MCAVESTVAMYLVRVMHLRDLNGVMIVNEKCFPTPWSYYSIRYDLQRNPHSYWIVLETVNHRKKPHRLNRFLSWFSSPSTERRIIGFTGFWLMNGEAHITNIGIDPDFRGRGWGEVLLTSVLQRAIELHADFSSLEVRVSNQPAIKLYQKYGYQFVGYKRAYYHDNREDAHDMATPFLNDGYQTLLAKHLEDLNTRLRWRDYFIGSETYETRRTPASSG